MQGFDAEFVDIVDYIIRITWRIWEMKGVERILDYYEEDMHIHTMSGEVVGSAAVVANTRDTLQAFPDRTLWGDDVIWSGNGQDGFYSSHRIVSNMTNLGAGEFGPATGRHATVITIADCAVKNNRIYEEWLVRDQLGLALQLGIDVDRLVAERARARTPEMRTWLQRQRADVAAAEGGPAKNAEIARDLKELWLGDITSLLQKRYWSTVTSSIPGAACLTGHGEVAAFWHSLRSLCENPVFSADHFCTRETDTGRAEALRWRISAKHKKNRQPIYILGITHRLLQGGQVAEEWIVFDELALRVQVFDV